MKKWEYREFVYAETAQFAQVVKGLDNNRKSKSNFFFLVYAISDAKLDLLCLKPFFPLSLENLIIDCRLNNSVLDHIIP